LKRLLILCFSLAMATPATADEGVWYAEPNEEGFYWYNLPLPLEDEEKEDEPETQTRYLPSLENFTYEDLWELHPDDFKKLISAFHKKALMTLGEEDMKEYLVVQQVAAKRSRAAMNLTLYLTQKYPALSAEADFPIAYGGRNAQTNLRREEVTSTINRAATEFALLYFYDRKCPYCAVQDRILKMFYGDYGWEIKRVEINDSLRLAEYFQAKTVPYLVLIHRRSENHFPVAEGVVTLDKLELKIYRGIRYLSGDVTPQEWSIHDFQKGGAFDVTQSAWPILELPETKN